METRLYLLFKIDIERYALDYKWVDRVISLQSIKEIPGTVRGISGVIDYQNQKVPVIDIKKMATGNSARTSVTTRIIIINYPIDKENYKLLGIVAESVNKTIHLSESDFTESPVNPENAQFLGDLVTDKNKSILQRITINKLLNKDVVKSLFSTSTD